MKPTYARDLQSRRESLGLTQQQFAKRAGISESAYQRIEAGEYNISFRVLRKVAIAMNCIVRISLEDTDD